MENRINLIEWEKNYKNGEYDSRNVHAQIAAGWYDWFCRDSSLANKTRAMAPKITRLMKSPKIDPKKTYVFFKNNCPVGHSLYDDFRFCDMETGDVLYTIVPRYSRTGKADVWGKDNDFSEPLVSGNWSDVLKFFQLKK